jgi:tRNA(fMet)-specific endonuclease VapC
MTPRVMLDSDTLSFLLRRNPIVVARGRTYAVEHKKLTFSLITRYEILRGMKVRSAKVQRKAFEGFCNANMILPLTQSIIDRAAEVYADLHRQGKLIGDADILIAATALEHGFVLATNNTKHFENVAGLQLVNWLEK